MADSDWMAYTGAITGIIGAITGMAGAVMGYISYRRTEDLKSLDLRLELRKAESDLHEIVKNLSSHIQYSKKSRERVLSAQGTHRSGAAQKWATDCDQDMTTVKLMIEKLPNLETDYNLLNHAELESRLVCAHMETTSARQLKEKYDAEIAVDDKARERIRDNHQKL